MSLINLTLVISLLASVPSTLAAINTDAEVAAAPGVHQEAVDKKGTKPEARPTREGDARQDTSTHYGMTAIGITLAVTGLMALLFWFLFAWSQRVEQAGYFGTIYQDTVENIEFGRLSATVVERWERNEYQGELLTRYSDRAQTWSSVDPRNAMPQPEDDLRELARRLDREDELQDAQRAVRYKLAADPWTSRRAGAVRPGTTPPGSRLGRGGLSGIRETTKDDQQKADERRFEELLDKYEDALNGWIERVQAQATRWFQDDLEAQRKKAKEQAERALNVDLSALRGRGSEFVLEFTTVVVIIFATVILGILKILDTQQIGTLLAAIAGYVLGRAATRGRGTQPEATAVVTPQPKV